MSASLEFRTTVGETRVVFAPGSILELADEVRRLNAERAFVIASERITRFTSPRQLLGDLHAATFTKAREHVPVETIEAGRARFEESRADVCIAIGGGSAIGLGKVLARDTGVPLIAVPTTYSGSEMTSVWGQTDAKGKTTGRDAKAKPRVVIYDVTLTLDLPSHLSATSGMNAMAHAVEATYAANASADTVKAAIESIHLLATNLPLVVADGRNLDARSRALQGAHLAGRALNEAAMGLHHRICHVLGGTFGLPHATTHAVVLPHVVRFNAPAATAAMTRISEVLGSDPADAITALNQALGINQTLGMLGLREPDLDRAAGLVVSGNYPNPRPASAADVRGILEAAL